MASRGGPGTIARTSAVSKARARRLEQEGKGILRDFFIKPFPIRCALEIGTDSMASMVVAKVDARHNAVQDVMYTQELPVNLQVDPSFGNVLTVESRKDLFKVVRQLLFKMENRTGIKPSEYSGLLTWPFHALVDRKELALEMTQHFKVNFQVLEGKQEGGNTSDLADRLSFDAYATAARVVNKHNLVVLQENRGHLFGQVGGIDLMAIRPRGVQEQQHPDATGTFVPSSTDLLRFADHKPGGEASGMNQRRRQELEALGVIPPTAPNESGSDELVKCSIPLSTLAVHKLLVTEVQQRAPSSYHVRCSPNPVQRAEFIQCRDVVSQMILHLLPQWLKEKTQSESGCTFATGGLNGNLFNTAARVAGKQNTFRDALDLKSEYHFCGLTDVLMGQNFVNPHLVLPQAALAAGAMRALNTKTLHYCHDVSMAHCVLTNPDFWLHQGGSRAGALEQEHLDRKAESFLTDKRAHVHNPRMAPLVAPRGPPSSSSPPVNQSPASRRRSAFAKFKQQGSAQQRSHALPFQGSEMGRFAPNTTTETTYFDVHSEHSERGT